MTCVSRLPACTDSLSLAPLAHAPQIPPDSLAAKSVVLLQSPILMVATATFGSGVLLKKPVSSCLNRLATANDCVRDGAECGSSVGAAVTASKDCQIFGRALGRATGPGRPRSPPLGSHSTGAARRIVCCSCDSSQGTSAFRALSCGMRRRSLFLV